MVEKVSFEPGMSVSERVNASSDQSVRRSYRVNAQLQNEMKMIVKRENDTVGV